MKNKGHNVEDDDGPLLGDEFQVSGEEAWLERRDCRFSDASGHFICPNHRIDSASLAHPNLVLQIIEAGKHLSHVTTRRREADVPECGWSRKPASALWRQFARKGD